MSDYYSEIILKIEELISNKQILEAKDLLGEELKVPYIPIDIETKLVELNKTVTSLLKENENQKEVSIEKIEEFLKGDAKQQLQAVSTLCDRNLRNHIDLIREYFSLKPNIESASLLIDCMIEQQIGEPIAYVKEGIEYTFVPNCLTKPYESDGFIQAENYLQEWIANDNPSMYEMCLQLLIHETYCYLPLTYEEDDGVTLALSICKKVMELCGEEGTFEQIVKKYDLKSVKTMEIMS